MRRHRKVEGAGFSQNCPVRNAVSSDEPMDGMSTQQALVPLKALKGLL